MTQTLEEQKPQLDPHPLSEYAAWAGHRNKEPILGVLKEKLPKEAGKQILELASGSGLHINYFAPHFDHLHFHPSDHDLEVFDNIKKLKNDHENDNIADPLHLDLTNPDTWFKPEHAGKFDSIFCINIFQVAPLTIADGMMECAAHLLSENGFLLVYGPFKLEGHFTTHSNKEFHDTLLSTGIMEWGLKDIADLKISAEKFGLELKEQIDMPSNNFSLIFARKK